MITIVDYGLGNLRSVYKAFKRLQVDVVVTSDPAEVASASKLVLPGVGHFKAGMEKLRSAGLYEILQRRVVVDHIPVLGICLGMQLLSSFSEEGDAEGFGWIPARTVHFPFMKGGLKVPHVGWNSLTLTRSHPLFAGISERDTFYFVHSYYVDCSNREDVVSQTEYGVTFDSAVVRGNIAGVQFHPEKSHEPGLLILKNFSENF